jgi:hypothetical protein
MVMFVFMGLLLLDVLGGLALDRSITAAVAGRHMDPCGARQYPMDMGVLGDREITPLFQYLIQNTMDMGSTPGGFWMRFGALSQLSPQPLN